MNKKRIRKEMDDYARAVGFPTRINHKNFIKVHINSMFKVLLSKGLVRPEWYDAYRRAAVAQYQRWFVFNRRR